MYRLLKFPLYSLSHIIYRLAINRNLNTTWTAWFKLNASDQDARAYLNPEIANSYVFNKQLKKLTVRKKKITYQFLVECILLIQRILNSFT